MNRNTWWKIAAAVLAVLLLSMPSAVGVYKALEPTRGAFAAGAAAAGFELAYLSLSLLTLRPELRRQAQLVAFGAVATAIALNGLADYAHRVPGGLASWVEAQRLFDPLALALAVGESMPLAGLAYALASLLHRLAEQPTRAEDDRWLDRELQQPASPAWAGPVVVASHAREAAQPAYPAPVEVRAPIAPLASDAANRPAPSAAGATEAAQGAGSNSSNTPAARDYACKHCGATGLTKAEQLAHGRRRARHGSCA
jgi:hypothetical protein